LEASIGKYSISLASRMTAIPAETLRIWERRYGYPKPARSPGGGRFYSDDDVEMLRLVARGLDAGYRPNELLGKSPAELASLLRAIRDASTPGAALPAGQEASIDNVLAPLLSDDVDGVRTAIRRGALALGPKGFVSDFAHPLVVRVGQLWADGRLDVRHEHFVSDCLETQLRVMLSAYEERERVPIVLLTTLPGEPHSLGLVMVALYLAIKGATPRLLGAKTPLDEIVRAARALRANVVGLTVTMASDLARAQEDVTLLSKALPKDVHLWIGGNGAPELEGTFTRITSWTDLDRALDALSP